MGTPETAVSAHSVSGQAAPSLWLSVKWVVFTSLTWVAVLMAATAPRWDTTLAACSICFARGRWARHGRAAPTNRDSPTDDAA